MRPTFETKTHHVAQEQSSKRRTLIRPARWDWKEHLRRVVVQHPLIARRPSLAAIDSARDIAPRAVFTGIGLCSQTQLSRAVPLDLLGLLLPALRVQQAIGARLLVALIADAHAVSNGFDAAAVSRRGDAVAATLERIKARLGLEQLQIIRASDLHRTEEYRAALAEVPDRDGDYFRFEVADVLCLNRRHGGLLKVGWTVGRTRVGRPRRDEVAFDRRFRAWTIGDHVNFVYCRAGRTLDQRRPKAAPYVTTDPAWRPCLAAGEDISSKLRRAERLRVPPSIRGAVVNQLKAITRSYAQMYEPLRGPVVHRAQYLIDRLCPLATRSRGRTELR